MTSAGSHEDEVHKLIEHPNLWTSHSVLPIQQYSLEHIETKEKFIALPKGFGSGWRIILEDEFKTGRRIGTLIREYESLTNEQKDVFESSKYTFEDFIVTTLPQEIKAGQFWMESETRKIIVIRNEIHLADYPQYKERMWRYYLRSEFRSKDIPGSYTYDISEESLLKRYERLTYTF